MRSKQSHPHSIAISCFMSSKFRRGGSKTRPYSVAVVGLGQIGGSLVLALRKCNARVHLTGIDTSRKLLRLLRNQIDTSSTNWKAAENADLIIICLHFQQTIDFLNQVQSNALILDVCSAKRKVLAVANRRKLRFIGGHPMAGNERAKEKGWDRNLFSAAPFFLCPGKNSSRADLQHIKRLISQLKAKPIHMDAAMHDRYVAISSHLPAFISQKYRQFSANVPAEFQGPGYRSFTRLSNTSAELMQTFLQANGDEIKKLWKQWRRWNLKHRFTL
jgi:prephenate dehydrogenase